MTAFNQANTMAKVQKNQAQNVASEKPEIPVKELMELYDKVHELFDGYELQHLVEHLNDMLYCWAEYSRKLKVRRKLINEGVYCSGGLVNFLVSTYIPYQKAKEKIEAKND